MNINGWDVICACSIEKLNKLLALQFEQTPASVSYTAADGTKLDIEFKPWEMMRGGTSKKLYFRLPIKSGTLVSALTSVDLSGAVAVIQAELDFFDNPPLSAQDQKAYEHAIKNNQEFSGFARFKRIDNYPKPSPDEGKLTLKFNFKASASGPDDTTDGSVFVSEADISGILNKRYPSEDSDQAEVAATTVKKLLGDCLVHNKSKLDYIFTKLNITPKGKQAWMSPKQTAYAFHQGKDDKSSHLAVFTTLTDRDVRAYSTDIDESLFDTDNDIFSAFSGSIFLEQMIMPHLPNAYRGAKSSNFNFKDNKIHNSGALKSDPVKVSMTHYYPVIDKLEISIKSSDIHSTASGHFDITGLAGSSVTFTESQNMLSSFDASKGKLTFKADGNPVTDYDKHIPWYIYLSAGPAVLALGPILGAIIVAIVDSIVAAVTSSVAKETSASSGNLGISDIVSSSIEWPGSGDWKVSDARLDDAFCLKYKI